MRIFIRVAETKSFSKTAEELFVSHSTVSRAVSSLENELCVKLIERGNAVQGLTPAGETLAEKGRELIALADKIAAELRKMAVGDERGDSAAYAKNET